MTGSLSPSSNPSPTTASWSTPSSLGQRAIGDDAGVRLHRQMGFEPILAVGHRLTRMARVGVDGGDDPIRGHLLGDAPASVGTVGALGGFDVLTRDQGQ